MSSSLSQRMMIGLSLLLLMQIMELTFAGLALQGLLLESWLPFIDRIVVLLSSISIIWLWGFPEPRRYVDYFTTALGILILSGSIIISVWWGRINLPALASPTAASFVRFNGSRMDIVLQVSSLVVIVLGLMILFLRRPASWGFGFAMMILLGIGHAAHLIYLPYGDNFPSVFRIFQIAAFPLLIILPQRELQKVEVKKLEPYMNIDAEENSPVEVSEQELLLAGIEPQMILSLLGLMENLNESQACRRIVTILSSVTQADFVSIVSPPDLSGYNRVLCGLERSENIYIGATAIDARTLPILNSCMKMGRIRSLPSSSSSPDRQSLAKIFASDEIGPMLFVPVLNAEGKPLNGVILASLCEENAWKSSDQAAIGLFVKFLIRFLIQSQQMAKVHHELKQSRQEAHILHVQVRQAVFELKKAREKHSSGGESSKQLQNQGSNFSEQNTDLMQHDNDLENLIIQNQLLSNALVRAEQEAARAIQPLQGELRLTLEEIAALRSNFELGERKTIDMSVPDALNLLSHRQSDTIIKIVQDLRRPISEIAGSTEILLGESVGIDTEQRLYLKKILDSALHSTRLLDKLLETSMVTEDQPTFESINLDSRELVAEAVEETKSILEKRELNLEVNVPDQPLMIAPTDENLLRKVVSWILRIAASETTMGGGLSLSLSIEPSDNNQNWILLRISQQIGIDPKDYLGETFKTMNDEESSDEKGDPSAEFAHITAFLERLGFQFSVKSLPQVGESFSLLIPEAQSDVSEPALEKRV